MEAVQITEMVQKLDKKVRGVYKRMKMEIDENSGKVKADLGMLQSDQKVTAEKIKLIEERLQETIREVKPISIDFMPALEDVQQTIDSLKEVQKKHQAKIDDLMTADLATNNL